MNKKIIAGIMSVAMLATMSATPIFATGEALDNPDASQSGTSDTTQQNPLQPSDVGYEYTVGNLKYKVTDYTDPDNPLVAVSGFANNATDQTKVEIGWRTNHPNPILNASQNSATIVSIAKGAFKDKTSITNVDICNVTEIGDYAFAGCTNLETVITQNNITHCSFVKKIGKEAFNGCSKLKRIYLYSKDDVKQTPGIQSIGENAFN